MAIPLKNTIHDRITESGSVTDVELYKALTKDGTVIPVDRYNKILLDLEIMGLIRVAWITKDERRIEIIEEPTEKDSPDKGEMEKDYEASFPGFQK